MLNCISGMVEKTQRAISILQQRQAEAANVRSAEELVADIQTKASLAIMEVKQAALEEIKQAKQETPVQTKSKEEVRKNNKKYENKNNLFYLYTGVLELWQIGHGDLQRVWGGQILWTFLSTQRLG